MTVCHPGGMTTPTPPEVSLVAAALRKAAEQLRCDADRDELQRTGDQVEADWDGMCCPLCQEVTCDDDCPLAKARASLAAEAPPIGEYRLSTLRREHDFQYGEDGVQRCTRCRHPHAQWAGRACPGTPQAWGPGRYV